MKKSEYLLTSLLSLYLILFFWNISIINCGVPKKSLGVTKHGESIVFSFDDKSLQSKSSSNLPSKSSSKDKDAPEISYGNYFDLNNFFTENLDLILRLEFEFFFLGAAYYFFTALWRYLINLERVEIIQHLFKYWNSYEVSLEGYAGNIVSYYLGGFNQVKSSLVDGYVSPKVKSEEMTIKIFERNFRKFDCDNLARTLTIILLITEASIKFLIQILLLYLLMCSFRELSQYSSFDKILMIELNIDDIVSKLISTGGKHLSNLFMSLKEQKSSFGYTQMENYSATNFVLHPIDLSGIEMKDFGYRFCVSLLELAFFDTEVIIIELLLVFFTSRMLTAAEVLLALDIIKKVNSTIKDLTKTILILLFEKERYVSLSKYTEKLHNRSLLGITDRFKECYLIKDTYAPTISSFLETDFQLKAMSKMHGRRRSLSKQRMRH